MRAICPMRTIYKDDLSFLIREMMYGVGYHAIGAHNYNVLFSSLREVPA